jgi:flagellar biosynthetic protein FliR
MTHSLLDYFVIGQLSAFLLIFCRVGSAVMVMPGFGDSYVTVRIRLLFAVAFTALLTPLLQPHMPMIAGNVLALFIQILGEVLVGVFIGLIARIVLAVVHVAGTIIAVQSSLSMASTFDPINANQSPVVSNILTIAAMTLFFTLNLHHLLFAAVVQSYDLFAPGIFPDVADMNLLNVRLIGDTFALGIMLAAPHIVYSLLFYLAGGLVARVVPNFQVFFIMMIPQIFIGILLLFALIPVIMDVFASFMQEQLGHFVAIN